MECQVELAELVEVEHLREPMVLEEMVAEAEPVVMVALKETTPEVLGRLVVE